jgi:ribokinase
MRVCSIGDVTLDVVLRFGGPIAAGGDTAAETHLGPGGQAANVAAWAGALGADASVIGKRGRDDTGRLVKDVLEGKGVKVLGPVEGRSAVVCSLVSQSGERSMLTDRGSAPNLHAEELEPDWFSGCDHLAVSGYALMLEPARGAALRAVGLARAAGARVSVDLASWSAIRDAGADEFRRAVDDVEPDVVFANEDEERIVGGPIAGAAWILKRGSAGCSFDGDERTALPVGRVVDTTGAGDALAAGWIVGGPDLALEAAARCITRVGSMPQ